MRITAIALLLGCLGAAPAVSQSAPVAAPAASARMSVFTVADADVAAALRRIDQGSPTWRAELDEVARRGGRVVVATVGELTGVPEQFARQQLAEVTPIAAADGSVREVLVVINRELLRDAYRHARGSAEDEQQDLARILIHEVYGHAVPYLVAGHVSGACSDPLSESDSRSCSLDRENVIRRELRLGVRIRYDLSGLALSGYLR